MSRRVRLRHLPGRLTTGALPGTDKDALAIAVQECLDCAQSVCRTVPSI